MAKKRARGNNEGSVYKRKDGLWASTINLGWQGGKRKRQTFYGKTQQEVLAKLRVAQQRAQEGVPVAPERQTVGKYLQRWIDECVEPSELKLRTKQGYSDIVRLHLVPELGRVKLAKLTAQDVQAMIARKRATCACRHERNKHADLGPCSAYGCKCAEFHLAFSPRRLQYIHATLRAALSQALRWDLVHRNVAKLVQMKGGSKQEIRPFTPEEARVFLDAVKAHRLEALFIVTLTLGLRQGEALGLAWDDVDLDAGVLHIRRTLVRTKEVVSLEEPKSERSRRTLQMPQIAINALRGHRARQLEERLLAGSLWNDTGLVFTREDGSPLRDTNVTKQFQTVLRNAGLRRQRFHDLRHAASSYWLAQGASLREVMGILGHSTIALTADLYTHLMPAVQREAAARMDALFAAEG